MKRLLIAACIAGTLMGVPATSFAQTTSATVAQPAVSARKLELTRRYLRAIKFEETMKATMDGVMPSMMEQMLAGQGIHDSKASKAASEAASESVMAFIPRMLDLMAPIYAEAFSEQELNDLVTFYEGPTGQSVMAKSRALAPKMGPVIVQLLPDLQADVHKRLCAKIDCGEKK